MRHVQLQSQHHVTTFLNYTFIRVKFGTLSTRITLHVCNELASFLEPGDELVILLKNSFMLSAGAFLC